MMRALTEHEIRTNERLAEEAKAKATWQTPTIPFQPWTIQADDLKRRISGS